MDAVDESFHFFSKLLHPPKVNRVDHRIRCVSPRIENQLRIAVIGKHAGKQLDGYQVTNRTHLRLRESPRAHEGLILWHVTRCIDVQDPPHVAVITVRVNAKASVGVLPAVLAPKPVLGTAELVSIWVDYRCHPNLASLQPALHRVGTGGI